MKNLKKTTDNSTSLKDLIINNPRARNRISIKEIEKEIKESERAEGKKHTYSWKF